MQNPRLRWRRGEGCLRIPARGTFDATRARVESMKRFSNGDVAAIFKPYPPAVRAKLTVLRALVLETARKTAGVGPLSETLKWGQPSYLTEETGSGSTVRIDRLDDDEGYAVYFHCQSGLVDRFRAIYPDTFRYEGKRAIRFAARDRLPIRALRHCIALALTHHLLRKAGRGG